MKTYFVKKDGEFLITSLAVDEKEAENWVAFEQRRHPDSTYELFMWDGWMNKDVIKTLETTKCLKKINWNWDNKVKPDMLIFTRAIDSELDRIPNKEVTREVSCIIVEEGKEPADYKQNLTQMESTNSFNRLIRDFMYIGMAMNACPERFQNGIVKLTYDSKTYNMRNEEEVKELRSKAIHFVGLPDL
jgi:hypothetical protein